MVRSQLTMEKYSLQSPKHQYAEYRIRITSFPTLFTECLIQWLSSWYCISKGPKWFWSWARFENHWWRTLFILKWGNGQEKWTFLWSVRVHFMCHPDWAVEFPDTSGCFCEDLGGEFHIEIGGLSTADCPPWYRCDTKSVALHRPRYNSKAEPFKPDGFGTQSTPLALLVASSVRLDWSYTTGFPASPAKCRYWDTSVSINANF